MPHVRTITAYAQVAGELRRRVLAGELEPGEKLLPERELCETFAASRITIRRALQILEDEQLVERQQGRGTFVSARPARKIPILSTDYVASVAEHAPDIKREVETVEWIESSQAIPAEVATALQLLRGGERLLFARRYDVLGDERVDYDEVYLRANVAEHLIEQDFSAIDFVPIWIAREHLKLGFSTQRIEAVPARRVDARRLGLRAGAPILKCTDLLHTSADDPVAMFVTYYRHDLFHMTTTINPPDRTADRF